MKCYLMAGLIQDFEISRKNGQCLLLSEGFQQSYDQQTGPQGQQATVLVPGVGAEGELEGAQDVLILESFSRDVLGHGLGVHKSCTSQGHATYGLRFIGVRVREAAAVRAEGSGVAGDMQFSVCRRRWLAGWGGGIEPAILLSK